MAATERLFSEFPPAQLYLDTNFVLDYFISSRPNFARVAPFLQRVVATGITHIHISSLSWIEFGYVVRRQDFRDSLPDNWRAQFQLERWEQPSVRQRYLQEMSALFAEFLSNFEWSEISLTPTVREGALFYMGEYNLDAQDAVHLASAVFAGVGDLASFDRDFRRVDGLYLWNDGIYTS